MHDDRMPPIPSDQWTDEQKEAAKRFERERGRPVFGPYTPLFRSPEVMLKAQDLGIALRYHSDLPATVSEFAILVVSREWSQQAEWYFHAPIAAERGVDAKIIEAVSEGRRPQEMPEELEIAHDVCMELIRFHHVSDVTYERAVSRFGERGFVDLVGIHGFCTFLANVMNAARTAVPSEPPGPPKLPDLPG